MNGRKKAIGAKSYYKKRLEPVREEKQITSDFGLLEKGGSKRRKEKDDKADTREGGKKRGQKRKRRGVMQGRKRMYLKELNPQTRIKKKKTRRGGEEGEGEVSEEKQNRRGKNVMGRAIRRWS